jgi:hypothetical protein
LAEFTINNYQFETTGVTPFYVNNSCHPCLNFDLTERQDIVENLDAQEHMMRLYEIHILIKAEMAFPKQNNRKM